MDKINYNQHDWNKGEVIKEENLDNMENGIKQATDKINEIIDTEQDFKDRMADIDRRIDINNEELVIARDGCDNLGQRIERDQQYIYNILNDGSYLEFNGTDVTVDNSKEGYTSNMVIKGQTYQNLIINANEIKNKTYTANSTQQMYPYKVLRKANTVYTIIAYVSKNTLDNSFSFVSLGRTKDGMPVTITNGITGLIKKSFTTNDNVDEDYFMEVWKENTTGEITIDYMILLEGDWTNKEVPSSITGIESVGEKEGNKISILSHGKNLFNKNNVDRIKGLWFDLGSNKIKKEGEAIYSAFTDYVKEGKQYKISYKIFNSASLRYSYAFLDENNNVIEGGAEIPTSKAPLGAKRLLFYLSSTGLTNEELNLIQIEEGTVETSYEPYKEDKKEILIGLDGGLKSLPNGVADTIEQREDGVYLVQRVGKIILDGDVSEQWYVDNRVLNNTVIFDKPFISSVNYRGDTMVNNKLNLSQGSTASDIENMEIFSNTLYVRINKSRLSTLDLNGFLKWLNDEPLVLYYELATPIETKLDMDTINLQTFKDITYILSENNIKPEVVCKAPVDINQTIADLQEEQEQLIGTYNTLKEENEAVKTTISELNEQEDVQTADMLDLDMRVLTLEEGLK